MKRLALAAVALAATLASAEPGWADTPPKTIGDALHRAVYAESYNRMMFTGGPMQPWFSSASAASQGRDQSASTVDVEGTPMQIFIFCEPKSCSSGLFAVIFSRDGKRAVGASDVQGALQIFGGPSIFEVDRLTGAFLP